MKKLLLPVALLFIAAAAISCTGKSSGTIDIGLAMPETHVERWQRDGEELKTNAEALGYKADVAYGNANQSDQNQQLEDFITRKAKLLIIGAVNEGAAEAVEKAAAEGVIVLAYDRLIINTDKYDYYITFDNYAVGQFQGRALEAALDLANPSAPQKTIVLFAGAATDNNAKYFFNGAMDVLRPYVQSKKLVIAGPAPLSSDDPDFSRVTTENWRPEIAKARMENLLNGDARNVTIDGVVAPNDTLARAIIEALSADGKYNTTETLPKVTGQDAELASIKFIRDGKQLMTVFKDTRKLSQAAIKLADQILKGETPSVEGARMDTETYNTGSKAITTFLLSPIEVNQQNYKEQLIDTGYYTEAELQQ